jgi:uncharacterized protein (DUF58 family)
MPNQRLRLTHEGWVYLLIWVALLAIGLWMQSNLILLTAGFASGPIVASVLISNGLVRRLTPSRRAPEFVFEGDTLPIDYTLDNSRRFLAALATSLEDELRPAVRGGPQASRIEPRIAFSRVGARSRERLRWNGQAPARGRYGFGDIELITSSPFGIFERRVTVPAAGELRVYPAVGQLTRRWHRRFRESTESRRGRRYERTVQQQEYHGLRDYRAGDSPRWIHWRTTARRGVPMVKEFEQQNEQDLALLLDPWLPRTQATAAQRAAVEDAIRFAATVCMEICRRQGRRLTLGWTGPSPVVLHGPASIKLLHEMLDQLSMLRPVSEGQFHQLFDAMPAATLRQAFLVIVSTRTINLADELERSSRLASTPGRGVAGHVLTLDVSRGDLADLILFRPGSGPLMESRLRESDRLEPEVDEEGVSP